MINLVKYSILVVVLCHAVFSKPILAQMDEPPSDMATIVFSPQLDIDLFYDVTTNKPRGQERRIGTVKQKLRFSKSDEGFVLTLTPVAMTIAGVTISLLDDTKLPKTLSGFFAPMNYDIGIDGTVIRVRNWEQEKQKLSGAKIQMGDPISEKQEESDEANDVSNKVIDFFLRMTAEQAAQYFLKDWTSVLGYGGAELDVDQGYQISTELEYDGIQVPAIANILLTREQENRALKLVEKTTLLKREDDKKIFGEFEALMMGAFEGDEKKQNQFRESMAQLEKSKVENHVEILFETKTGMPIEALISKSITLPSSETTVVTTQIHKTSD